MGFVEQSVGGGLALAGVLIVAGIAKVVLLDGLGWLQTKSSGYLAGAGSDPFS